MHATIFLLWLGNILLDTIGQLAFKAAAVAPNEDKGMQYWFTMARLPWIWIGVGSYVMEFLLWLAFLSLVPLSTGILLGSINIVAVMLAGRWLFHEKLTRLRILGIALVAVGVAIVGAFG
jgi:drug/metabolite transporter (DMT)-like permease